MSEDPVEIPTRVDKNVLDNPWLKEYLTVIRLLEKIETAPAGARVEPIRKFLLYLLVVPDYVAASPTFRTKFIHGPFMVAVRQIPELSVICSLVDEMIATLPTLQSYRKSLD